MSVIKIRDESGEFVDIPAIKGEDGNISFEELTEEQKASLKGENGATFTPHVYSNGKLSWSNDKGLENPPSTNVKGPKGDQGEPGQDGTNGTDGKDGKDGTSVTCIKVEDEETALQQSVSNPNNIYFW